MLVIIALNNSLKKRVEQASKAAADFLNHIIFTASGPVKSLAGYLGATGEHAGECLLQFFIPDGYSQTIFPYSDTESASTSQNSISPLAVYASSTPKRTVLMLEESHFAISTVTRLCSLQGQLAWIHTILCHGQANPTEFVPYHDGGRPFLQSRDSRRRSRGHDQHLYQVIALFTCGLQSWPAHVCWEQHAN